PAPLSTLHSFPTRRSSDLHHGVARNFQNIRLMPHLSALENVLVGQHCQNGGFFGVLQPVNLMPGNRWREEARAALEEAGLAAYEDRKSTRLNSSHVAISYA